VPAPIAQLLVCQSPEKAAAFLATETRVVMKAEVVAAVQPRCYLGHQGEHQQQKRLHQNQQDPKQEAQVLRTQWQRQQ